MGSNIYMFLIALINKRKEYINEGGENCIMRISNEEIHDLCYNQILSEW